MRKAWRNPHQVIVNQALAEPEDTRRRERLVILLATGMERLLSQEENTNVPVLLDFKPEVSNTCIPKEETKTEIP
jgi:hypothetical protein